MKHKLLQTWARKSAKLLAAVALLATTSYAAMADVMTIQSSDLGKTDNTYVTASFEFSTNDGNKFTTNNVNPTTFQIRGNQAATKSNFYLYNNTEFGTIKEIKLTATGNNLIPSKISLYLSDTAYTTEPTGEEAATGGASNTSATNSATLTAPDNNTAKYFYIKLAKGATSGTCKISKIEITYEALSGNKQPAGLSFNPESVTIDLGDAFEAPVLTKDTDATIAWDSTDKTVATVDADGNVTVLAVGTTDITATAAENDNFYGGSASYKLTVNDPNSIYSNACTSSASGFTKWSPEGSTNPWSFDSQYGMKATGYKNSENTVTDGIIASPVLDLTNRKNATLKFNQAVNQFKGSDGKTNLSGDDMTVILEDISVVVAEVSTDEMPTEWTTLTAPALTLPETQSWNFYAQDPMDLTAYAGKKIRIGFRYVSTAERAGTWEIQNVNVTGEKKDSTVGIDGIEAEDGKTVYFNLQGVRVQNPEKGIFIRVQNGKATKIMK